MMTAPPPFLGLVMTTTPAPKLFTLTLVEEPGRLLLGRKKRGFGAGYYNGFGGKVEAGETVQEAALRELTEEAGITALDLKERGMLTFVFDDGKHWEVHVFGVTQYSGTPSESEEMAPQWFSHQEVPYHQMWADDKHWYPLFLQGLKFRGLFAFANTTELVWHVLSEVPDPKPLPTSDWLQLVHKLAAGGQQDTGDAGPVVDQQAVGSS